MDEGDAAVDALIEFLSRKKKRNFHLWMERVNCFSRLLLGVLALKLKREPEKVLSTDKKKMIIGSDYVI